MTQLGSEPVAIIGAIVAILTAVQQIAFSTPSGVHAAIASVIVILGAVVARSQVTPVQAPPVAPPPVRPPL